ncbi:MAG: maleylpyruvate isomerase N-terminal domain-containing protein [Propionicimonas sp.]|uniref:maleylpyruvate isomerase N-terminal domain-containing protein n=1 Tax=Propionicimonas sp. TaxID=1955623 RepID=UPI003D0EE9AF
MTTTPAPDDPRPLLGRALDQAGRLVTTTDPGAAGAPTPCGDFDVATLVQHLLAVERRMGAVVRGEPFASVPRLWPSEDWGTDWASGRASTDAALAAADLGAPVRVPWGEVPSRGRWRPT